MRSPLIVQGLNDRNMRYLSEVLGAEQVQVMPSLFIELPLWFFSSGEWKHDWCTALAGRFSGCFFQDSN